MHRFKLLRRLYGLPSLTNEGKGFARASMEVMCCLICLLLLINSALLAAGIPVGSPISDRLFTISRELYGRGIINSYEYARIDTPDSNNQNDINLVNQFNILNNDYNRAYSVPKINADLNIVESNQQQTSNSNFVKLFPQINIDFNRRLSANILYRVDGELSRDTRYDGARWHGLAGFPENATLDYQAGSFGARFGIERLSWGFANYGNLMFAGQAMPMTLLAVSYHRWIFDFEAATAFLNPLKSEMDLSANDTLRYFTSQERYLSTHSITIRPIKSLSLSAREVVLYGGPGRRLEPGYLFPFVWYHGQQLNSRYNDNILGSVGADWRWSGHLWLYGELLIDDIQVERKTRGDYEPNEIAYMAGTEVYDFLFRRTTIALEYERVNNWTYNQSRDHNRYINLNYPIGFPDGPDNDIIDWRLSWWANKNIKLSYIGRYRRHGAGRIDTPWTRPWLEVDNYSEPFPSGTVERQAVNGLEVMVLNKNWLWGNFGLKYSDIVNVDNFPGRKSKSWDMSIDIGIKLPPLTWGF